MAITRETVLHVAKLARLGFATVAIDFSGHGSRAVRISKDITQGCMGRCAAGGVIGTDECDSIVDANTASGMCPGTGIDPTVTCGVAATASADAMFVPPSPTSATQCYAPFLSTNLAATRDSLRQTVLDLQRVALALKTCGGAGCGGLVVDPTKILYGGMSLGGILGSITTATQPDIKAAALSVPGAGWGDLLENTETLEFRCPLVDSLIDG